MPGTPIDARHCPKCRSVLSLWRVAASPSPDYEAHTFDCANCRFRYTARIETPAAVRASRLEQGWPTTRASRHFLRMMSSIA
jgi:hypothetical protein